jgi:O-antigen biosynthesis protein WbqV
MSQNMGERNLRRMLGHATADQSGGCAKEFLKGKRVLITGAAGSVGSSVAVQLAEQGCARLALLDQFDHGLLDIVEQTRAIAPDLDVVEALCDICDPARLVYWLKRIQPDVVIHAAALKHVHLGERHPIECVRTNLIGVRNVIMAASAAGTGDFLLISSDKAASPVCVMGATKRLAELYLSGFAHEHRTDMRLRSVRFGNVYGSQGSVTPRFAAQIAEGGPLQITHPDMQRFFMTAEDAVRLILSVTALTDSDNDMSGSYYMDMGEPVSILELGRQMIRESGKKIPIKYTGLREGEKLREELFDEFEIAAPCALENVYRVTPSSPSAYLGDSDVAKLEALMQGMDDALTRRTVFALLDERLGRYEAIAG